MRCDLIKSLFIWRNKTCCLIRAHTKPSVRPILIPTSSLYWIKFFRFVFVNILKDLKYFQPFTTGNLWNKWHHFGAYELILLLSVNNDHRRPSGGPIRKSWSLEEGIHCSRHHWALIKGREIRWRTLWARRSSCWLSCKSVHSEIYENIWTNMNRRYKYWMLSSESSVAFEQLVKVRSKFSVVT